MSHSFTVITPTGDRPEVIELCKYYMFRQTLLPAQWIIVDDGKTPLPASNVGFVTHVRREPRPSDPEHTLTVQMLEAFKYVKHDRVLIMEDDDWYCPEYCEKMMKLFADPSNPELIGQGQAVYYHIPRKGYYVHRNIDRASWCQSGFRADLIPQIKDLCKDSSPFLDLRTWKLNIRKKLILNQQPLCIGIKGLPGRTGTTRGHTHVQIYKPDADTKVLAGYIGKSDVELYRKFMK